MASLTIQPGGPLKGSITVPGDKSITHRAMMLGALANGESTITGICRGEDCLNTLRIFRELGIRIDDRQDHIHIEGKGLWGLSEPDIPLDCGNSGTGLRLLAGLLAGQDFFSLLTGDESVRHRPMGRVVTPLRQMGAIIAGRNGGERAPLALTGTHLHGITYDTPVASAQIKSALLLAGLFADGPTCITEPQLSRDHTERLFRFLGIPLRQEGHRLVLEGPATVGWPGKNLAVPGDLSAAAFFIIGALVVPGSEVTLPHVGINPTRSGILEVLDAMGADLHIVNPREEGGEPVGDICVKSSALRGVSIGADKIATTIDEFPIICVAAALAEGDTVISGAGELRIKESDRIATMASELTKMGGQLFEKEDGLIIHGLGSGSGKGNTKVFKGASCTSYGDHRVAMSLAIAGLVADSPTTITHTECIDTSFPGFHANLLELLTNSA